jgi:RNA polymerase sigma-70 factor (ECF subfamily)
MSKVEAIGETLNFGGGGRTATAPAKPVTSAPAAEAALVEAARGGDREAFGRLYQLYAPLAHGILLARVPRNEVDDLTQEVFLAAFKKLHTLRDSAAFGPWLAMIARNRAMDFHRQREAHEELTEEMACEQGTEAERAEALEVLAIIRSLPEAYRETLILRLVEGMSGPEIAERTGLQPDSVRVNLSRGMKMLRERFRQEER